MKIFAEENNLYNKNKTKLDNPSSSNSSGNKIRIAAYFIITALGFILFHFILRSGFILNKRIQSVPCLNFFNGSFAMKKDYQEKIITSSSNRDTDYVDLSSLIEFNENSPTILDQKDKILHDDKVSSIRKIIEEIEVDKMINFQKVEEFFDV